MANMLCFISDNTLRPYHNMYSNKTLTDEIPVPSKFSPREGVGVDPEKSTCTQQHF